jgi:hypothetical protein
MSYRSIWYGQLRRRYYDAALLAASALCLRRQIRCLTLEMRETEVVFAEEANTDTRTQSMHTESNLQEAFSHNEIDDD